MVYNLAKSNIVSFHAVKPSASFSFVTLHHPLASEKTVKPYQRKRKGRMIDVNNQQMSGNPPLGIKAGVQCKRKTASFT